MAGRCVRKPKTEKCAEETPKKKPAAKKPAK